MERAEPPGAGDRGRGPPWAAVRALVGRVLVTRVHRPFRVVAVHGDRVLVAWLTDGRRWSVARRWLEAAWARRVAGRPEPPGAPATTVVAALLDAADEELRRRP